MALGASSSSVLGLICPKGSRRWAPETWPARGSRRSIEALSSLLYEVEAIDPVTFAVVPLLVAALGLLAVYVPARRATWVDPRAAALISE